jgi:hypothetical protein
MEGWVGGWDRWKDGWVGGIDGRMGGWDRWEGVGGIDGRWGEEGGERGGKGGGKGEDLPECIHVNARSAFVLVLAVWRKPHLLH